MNRDVSPIRAELLHLRDQSRAQAAALDSDLRSLFEASRSSNADDEHDPEGSTIAFERAQLTAVLEATRRRLAELDVALRRIEAGTYGVCERCSRPIPAERLAARPSASTCVGCAGRK
ncbi:MULTISPECIES: TraR/DksA C4-type zinc finger protein [unclassified Micromonospora]|uniref:TraR/DksA family transcriptional regulator n=1 Tax=unclassified Micromonospora TaxID=2617518 RepID=UPI000EF48A2B|nr:MULTISPECIES: TraR/DksA C4-type zinc finger protein [unclassified Micromonospora]RLP85677.1 DnaK-like suppressor protein [Micromonospora sp. BL4]RLP97246.1 DnaK-like suppressor protein [Micromonospora sp. CV4]